MTVILILVLGGLFGLLGGAAEGDEGFVLGVVLGTLTGLYLGLRIKLGHLQRRIADTEDALKILVSAAPAVVTAKSAVEERAQADVVKPRERSEPQGLPADPDTGSPAPSEEGAGSPGAVPESAPDPWLDTAQQGLRRPPGAAFADKLWVLLKGFFSTGNVVVKVGLVVLFFGVSFLIKYAHERALMPIEFRLAAVATVGVVLLVVGWKLRRRNPGYAMALQGGAVGILYLTVFGAARLYHVLPMGLAFAVMIGLVLLSGALAVLQNAPALAAFGSAGGFLAPVLTSTGEGSHVALFSYYALLNLGIFGIAWFKSWRILNWLGFVFTFIIATAWGARYYRPEHFASTEPFLILFTLFYIGITILFATRQPPRLRGLVDASLVFGVPTVAFALQSRLVREIDFGLAYSSLILGASYVALAFTLWRRGRDHMRLLSESFLALGVVFLSLAIPLAMDGHWTAAAWSLEAVGIIWIGLRQSRPAARAFGVLLQIGAATLFLLQGDIQTTTPVLFNSAYVGSIMIAIAGVLSAYLYARYRLVVHRHEEWLENVFLAWGLLWWFGAGANEIFRHLPSTVETAALIAFATASLLGLAVIARRLAWDTAAWPAIGLLPVLVVFAGFDFAEHAGQGPFRGPYGIAWLVAIGGNYALLAWFAQIWGRKWQASWHAGSVWLVTFLLAWAVTEYTDHATQLSDAWVYSAAVVVPVAILTLLVQFGRGIAWPVVAFENSYRYGGLAPIAAYLCLWTLASVTQAGGPAPLPYIPVLNPIEAGGLIALASLLTWWSGGHDADGLGDIPGRHVAIVLGVLSFIWFNAVLFRGIHHITGTPYDLSLLWRSPTLQSTISLAWTILGSTLMALAALQLKLREVWIAGALVLALVVVKLFTVDLADIGTVARIVSFMSVGLLLLVIGYFAPLPPRAELAE